MNSNKLFHFIKKVRDMVKLQRVEVSFLLKLQFV